MKSPDHNILVPAQTKEAMVDVAVCSIGLVVFAYFINYPLPIKIFAFMPLVIVAFIMSRNITLKKIALMPILNKMRYAKLLAYNIIGLQIGFAGALYYRGSYGMRIFPEEIRIFAFAAAAIALMEELVFRGFIQGRISKYYPVFAIIFAAFAHALYKASLFLSPAVNYHQSVMLFFTYTFGASLLIGVIRFHSKSIMPAIIAHVVFDIVVYGESVQSPWWVW